MQASDALPSARQSDQLWRRGLAVGQLAEVMLYSTHSYSSKECVWFTEMKEDQDNGVEYTTNPLSLPSTIDALITSLALATRSLELLRVSFERRSRGGSISHSSHSQVSRSQSRSQSGQPPLHASHGSTMSMDASSGGSSSTEAYETAMRNQITHYAEVTRSASKQLKSLLELNAQSSTDTIVNDWNERSENAIHQAVLSMARRASGLQALTSTCTTSPMARKHSSSHAQSLYEHSLCLLEDLLANSQSNQIKFICLAGLAEKITGRLNDLMSL